MLPPFRVRNLRRPRSPVSGRFLAAGSSNPHYDSIIRISAPEYDTTLSEHPEASLKYLDAEDGDMVTVGSSLELAQRLEDSVVRLKLNTPNKPVVRTMHLAGSKHSLDSPLLHVFDIDCQGDSLKVWQEIELRRQHMDAGNGILKPPEVLELRGLKESDELNASAVHQECAGKIKDPAAPMASLMSSDPVSVNQPLLTHKNDLNVLPPSFGVADPRLELDNSRQRYFQACNPPQLQTAPIKQAGAGYDYKPLLHNKVNAPPAAVDEKCATAFPGSTLTLEGKRQAQAAGVKLRARTSLSRHRTEGPEATHGTIYENRWASYNNRSTSSSILNGSQSLSPICREPSLPCVENKRQEPVSPYVQNNRQEPRPPYFQNNRPAQIIGEKLRVRTNPIRHLKPPRGSPDHGINRNRWPSYTGSRSARDHERLAYLTTAVEHVNYTESAEQSQSGEQSSLLQLFEAELAGLSKISSGIDDTKQASAGQLNSASPRSRHILELPGSSGACTYVKNSEEPGFLSVGSATDSMGPVSSHFRKDDSAVPPPRLQFAQTLDPCLREALNSFGTCVHKIADAVQNASTSPRLETENTKLVDPQLFIDAVQGLQKATEAMAVLGQNFIENNLGNNAKAVAQDALQATFSPANGKDQPCSVLLWPMPGNTALMHDTTIALEINHMLRSITNDAVKISVTQEKDEGLRMAFCKVESEKVALGVCQHMRSRSYHGKRLHAGIISAPASSFNDQVTPETAFSGISQLRTLPFPLNNANRITKSTNAEFRDAEEATRRVLKPQSTMQIQGDAENNTSDQSNLPKKQLIALSEPASLSPDRVPNEHKSLISGSSHSKPDTQRYWDPLHLDWERSRSPLRQKSHWDHPLRCSSPLRPASHRPGPIHLPQDEIDLSITDCPLRRCSGIHDHRGTFAPDSFDLTTKLYTSAGCDGRTSNRVSSPRMSAKARSNPTTFDGMEKPKLYPISLSLSQNRLRELPEIPPYANPSAPQTSSKSKSSSGSSGVDAYRSRQFSTTDEPMLKPSPLYLPLNEDSGDHVFAPTSKKEDRATCGRHSELFPGNFEGLPSWSGLGKMDGSHSCDQNVLIPTASDSVRNSRTVEESSREINSTPAATRFPSLEQFAGSFAGKSNFPPLPSMESLIPLRPDDQVKGLKRLEVDEIAQQSARTAQTAMPDDDLSSLDHHSTMSDVNKSFEDSNRMIRLSEATGQLTQLPSASLARQDHYVPSPRLAGPLNSLTETLQHQTRQFSEGLKNYATSAGPASPCVAKCRSTCSEDFGDSGGLPRESSFENGESWWMNGSSSRETPGINSRPHRSVTENKTKSTAPSSTNVIAVGLGELFASNHTDPTTVEKIQGCMEKLQDLGFCGNDDGSIRRLLMYAQAAKGNLGDAIDIIDRENSASEHSDPATVEKIQGCVETLKVLGFGENSEGGVKRLVVYAQAAKGDLSDAIDMIDEEQRAYLEWSH